MSRTARRPAGTNRAARQVAFESQTTTVGCETFFEVVSGERSTIERIEHHLALAHVQLDQEVHRKRMPRATSPTWLASSMYSSANVIGMPVACAGHGGQLLRRSW